MSWPVDEAQRNALHALLTLEDTKGDDEAIRFLEQELVRLHVLKQLHAKRRALLAAPQGQAADTAAEANRANSVLTGALDFYADKANWKRRGNKPSLAAEDGGFLAREAFTKIAEEDK